MQCNGCAQTMNGCVRYVALRACGSKGVGWNRNWLWNCFSQRRTSHLMLRHVARPFHALIPLRMQSVVHWLIPSLTHPLIHSFIHTYVSYVHLFRLSLLFRHSRIDSLHSFMYLLISTFNSWFIRSFFHSIMLIFKFTFIYDFIRSFIEQYVFTHAFVHGFIHWFTHWFLGHPSIKSCPHSVISLLIAYLIPCKFLLIHFIPRIFHPCIQASHTNNSFLRAALLFKMLHWAWPATSSEAQVRMACVLWGCEPCRSSLTEFLERLSFNSSCVVLQWSWISSHCNQVSLANSFDPQRVKAGFGIKMSAWMRALWYFDSTRSCWPLASSLVWALCCRYFQTSDAMYVANLFQKSTFTEEEMHKEHFENGKVMLSICQLLMFFLPPYRSQAIDKASCQPFESQQILKRQA